MSDYSKYFTRTSHSDYRLGHFMSLAFYKSTDKFWILLQEELYREGGFA